MLPLEGIVLILAQQHVLQSSQSTCTLSIDLQLRINIHPSRLLFSLRTAISLLCP